MCAAVVVGGAQTVVQPLLSLHTDGMEKVSTISQIGRRSVCSRAESRGLSRLELPGRTPLEAVWVPPTTTTRVKAARRSQR